MIEELLKDVKLDCANLVDKFIENLETKITGLKPTSTCSLKDVRIPLIVRQTLVDEVDFIFEPPAKLDVIGSYSLGSSLNSGINIDLAMKIPSICWTKRDLKNYTYHYKRAFYLAYVARQLNHLIHRELDIADCDDTDIEIKDVQFRYFVGDFSKPVMVITPRNLELSKKIKIQIFAYAAKTSKFKCDKLHPKNCNVDPFKFYSRNQLKETPFSSLSTGKNGDKNQEQKEGVVEENMELEGTSFYNMSILFDLELLEMTELLIENLKSDQTILDACILMKMWLHQRELSGHFSFIMTMFLAHLHTKRTIHRNMNAYYIFRLALTELAEGTDWSSDGLSFYEDHREKAQTFLQYFPVVFISPSGLLNLCYNINLDLFNRLKHEAKLSLNLLHDRPTEASEYLLLQSVDFYNKFDVTIHIPDCLRYLKKNLSNKFDHERMNRGFVTPRTCAPSVIKIIERALSNRIILCQQTIEDLMLDKLWSSREFPPIPDQDQTLKIGLLLTDESVNQIDRGPEAQAELAEQFREFWGTKSELRKFADGSICEAVFWETKNHGNRRKIIEYILRYILRKQLHIRELMIYQLQLERFISLSNVSFDANPTREGKKDGKENSDAINESHVPHRGDVEKSTIDTGEEIFLNILQAYNRLSKIIRSIDDLKFSVNSIQPISPVLRSCEPFPSLPIDLQSPPNEVGLISRLSRMEFPVKQRKPLKINRILDLKPVEFVLGLEGTGKWPTTLVALEAAKCDFLIDLCEKFDQQFGIRANLQREFIDLIYDEFIFRVKIKCPKEFVILHSFQNDDVMRKKFDSLHFELELKPLVCAKLAALSDEHRAFSLTCRLVKRWLASHLMHDLVDSIVIELLVARLFVDPAPYTPPATSLSGFRRFIQMIGEHDWRKFPLFINFDHQLKSDEINKIKMTVVENRHKYPTMIICTPFERDLSRWTREKPRPEVLDLLIKLSKKASSYLKDTTTQNNPKDLMDSLNALFRPTFTLFDLIIKIKTGMVQNFFMAVDAPDYKLTGSKKVVLDGKKQLLPIINFNVIEKYVQELREKFDHLASFFFDPYGQGIVGVIMRKGSEKTLEGQMNGFINDLRHLGSGLVHSIVRGRDHHG